MKALVDLRWRSPPCGSVNQYIRRCERVVRTLAGGTRTGLLASTSREAAKNTPEALSAAKDRLRAAEATSTSSASVSEVSQPFKTSRSLRLLQAESRRLGERRFLAFLSAVALMTLAWYGQDLISQLGRITRLPVDEIDGLIYFVVCFFAVSLVLPKSRYDL